MLWSGGITWHVHKSENSQVLPGFCRYNVCSQKPVCYAALTWHSYFSCPVLYLCKPIGLGEVRWAWGKLQGSRIRKYLTCVLYHTAGLHFASASLVPSLLSPHNNPGGCTVLGFFPFGNEPEWYESHSSVAYLTSQWATAVITAAGTELCAWEGKSVLVTALSDSFALCRFLPWVSE